MRPFAVIFLGLLLMTLVAWRINPRGGEASRQTLLWASDDNPARREHIDAFRTLHPSLNVQLDPDNGGMEKVIVQCMGGVGPDLFDCYTPEQLQAYVRAGIAWDVTDALRESGIDVERDTWPTVRPYAVFDGRTYGFPSNASVDALWFNRDALDEAGVAPPSGPMTWDAFIPLAQKLTTRDASGRVTRYGLVFDDEFMWKMLLTQWRASMFSADGKRCTLDDPAAIAAAEFLHDLIYKYGIAPAPGAVDAMTAQGGWGSASMKLFSGGRAATAVGGRWWSLTLRKFPTLRLGAAECPHGPSRAFLGYGKSTLINRNSPNREAALVFLKKMASPEYTQRVNRQADGLGPVPQFCTPESLVNPSFPGEDFHGVFLDVAPLGVSPNTSRYVSASLATRLMNQQLDLLRRNAKTPEQAMRDAAAQINAALAVGMRREGVEADTATEAR